MPLLAQSKVLEMTGTTEADGSFLSQERSRDAARNSVHVADHQHAKNFMVVLMPDLHYAEDTIALIVMTHACDAESGRKAMQTGLVKSTRCWLQSDSIIPQDS